MKNALHPIKWLKAKWQAYLDYDQDWQNDYKKALAPVEPVVQVRPRWGQPDPQFDYLFKVEETEVLPKLRADGTIVNGETVNREMVTLTFRKVQVANADTAETKDFPWVKQVLDEMEAEFRSRLMADPIDETDHVYTRRHREAISAAAIEDRRRFQAMELPDWDADWDESLRSDVVANIIRRARHASDRGATDTMTMQRIQV